MKAPGALTVKVLALIVLEDLGSIVAQLLLKKGVAATGIERLALDNLADFSARALASPLLWAGVLVYAVNFFLWILILYKIDISVAVPLGSLSYVLVPLAATIFLHEHVGPVRWAGIALIAAGIYAVSRTRGRAPGGGAHA